MSRSALALSGIVLFWVTDLTFTALARMIGILGAYGFGPPGESTFMRFSHRFLEDGRDSLDFVMRVFPFVVLFILLTSKGQTWIRLVAWTVLVALGQHLLFAEFFMGGNYKRLFFAPIGLVVGLLHPSFHAGAGSLWQLLTRIRVFERS